MPNVVRISFVKDNTYSDDMLVLETNIDDVSGELLGTDFQQGLFLNGAVDFYFSPVQMKKGRPGLLLSCIVKETDFEKLSDYILEQTSTIGVRYYKVKRKVLERAIKTVQTKYGEVKIKVVTTPSGLQRKSFEYNDLAAVSKREGVSIISLQQELAGLL